MERLAIRNHVSRELGARRLTIKELARQSGLSYGTLFALYHDKTRGIDFSTLDALCRTLGVQISDLLEYVPDAPGETAA